MTGLMTKKEFVDLEKDEYRELYLDEIFGEKVEYPVLAKVSYEHKKKQDFYIVRPVKIIVLENNKIKFKNFKIFADASLEPELIELMSKEEKLNKNDYVLMKLVLNTSGKSEQKKKYPLRGGEFIKFVDSDEILKKEYFKEESLIGIHGDKNKKYYCVPSNNVLEILKQLVEDYYSNVDELKKQFEKLGKLKEGFKAKTVKLGRLKEEFNTKTDELGKLKEEFNTKTDELGKLKEEFNMKTDELTDLNKQYDELINKNNILRKYSEVILDVNAISEEDKKQEAYEQSSFGDLAQSIVRECRYEYDVNLIKSMLCGIYSEQLVILAGAPGSGKTTFAKEFTKAIGYEAPIIPVQANWMDKSDLLGYYNPIEKCYMPTPFLEKLTHIKKLAEKYTDRYFFICLDEMNLSCVEYYFADFLSSLQTEERTIDLYSKSIWEHDFKELNSLAEKDIDVRNKLESLCCYRYSIIIPKNIRFICTINIDDTTKDLSPKVVDRAFFIRLENNDMSTNENRNVEYKKYLKYVTLSGDIKLDDVLKLKEKFKKSGVTLSRRFDRAVKKICVNTPNASEIKDEIKDILVSGLVLPKLRKKCKLDANMKYSKAILKKMDVDGEVSYWRSLE